MALDGFFPATAMPDQDWWAALWPDPMSTMQALGIRPGMTVVDLCCGDGYFTAPMAQIVEGRVYAVDIDPAMLEQARAAIERAGASVLDLIRADARDLAEMLPGKADYVLIANTFHGVPDQLAMARAVAAVLTVGGQFAIINWYPLPREDTTVLGQPRGPKTEMRMSPDDTRLAVEPAGFALEQVVAVSPYHYGAIFTLIAADE